MVENINPPAPPNQSRASEDLSLLDFMQVIIENIRLLFLLPLGAAILAVGLSFFATPQFTATTKILPPQQQQGIAAAMLQSLGTLSGIAGAAAGVKNPNDQFIAFLRTRSLQETIIERFALQQRYGTKFREDARQALNKHSGIASGKENLITIEFEDHDPKFAADVANGYVEELGKLMNRLAITEAQQRRVFFESQLSKTKEALIKAEQALASSGVSSGVLNATPTAAIENMARLRAMATAQDVKAAGMRNYLTESAPEYRQALAEASAIRSQIARAEREQPAQNSGNDYIAKFREFKYQEALFDLFAKQYESARIDESREGSVIQVVDAAVAPEKKSSPKRGLIGASVWLGTVILIMLWLVARYSFLAASNNPEDAARLANLRKSFAKALGRRT